MSGGPPQTAPPPLRHPGLPLPPLSPPSPRAHVSGGPPRLPLPPSEGPGHPDTSLPPKWTLVSCPSPPRGVSSILPFPPPQAHLGGGGASPQAEQQEVPTGRHSPPPQQCQVLGAPVVTIDQAPLRGQGSGLGSGLGVGVRARIGVGVRSGVSVGLRDRDQGAGLWSVVRRRVGGQGSRVRVTVALPGALQAQKASGSRRSRSSSRPPASTHSSDADPLRGQRRRVKGSGGQAPPSSSPSPLLAPSQPQ